ncbi:hypothetical protein ACLOJK_007786 [Asimina triloba]
MKISVHYRSTSHGAPSSSSRCQPTHHWRTPDQLIGPDKKNGGGHLPQNWRTLSSSAHHQAVQAVGNNVCIFSTFSQRAFFPFLVRSGSSPLPSELIFHISGNPSRRPATPLNSGISTNLPSFSPACRSPARSGDSTIFVSRRSRSEQIRLATIKIGDPSVRRQQCFFLASNHGSVVWQLNGNSTADEHSQHKINQAMDSKAAHGSNIGQKGSSKSGRIMARKNSNANRQLAYARGPAADRPGSVRSVGHQIPKLIGGPSRFIEQARRPILQCCRARFISNIPMQRSLTCMDRISSPSKQ